MLNLAKILSYLISSLNSMKFIAELLDSVVWVRDKSCLLYANWPTTRLIIFGIFQVCACAVYEEIMD